MICDEFRRRWLDAEPATRREGGSASTAGRHRDATDAGLAMHLDDCPSCSAWAAGQVALDDALASALLVAAPAELSARLARIPAAFGQPSTETAGQRALGLAFLVVLALGAIGVSGAAVGIVLGLIWPAAADALPTLTLILDSPVVGYYQNVASTLLEALATLVLAALLIVQLQPSHAPPGESQG